MPHHADIGTWPPIKALKLMALFTLIGVTIWQCLQNFLEYSRHEAVTTVSKKSADVIEFPQVTICNYNRWEKDLLSPEEQAMTVAAYAKAYGQASLQEVSYNETIIDVYNFTYQKGWHLVDQYNTNLFTNRKTPNTLRYCTFAGADCSTKFFKHRMTSYGNCYTFNKDLTPSDVNETEFYVPLAQTHASESSGFEALIDIKASNYAERILTDGKPQLGIKVIVHSKDEQPDPETSGVAIGPGFYGSIAVQRTEYNNQLPPVGACNQQKVLQNFDTYTISACAAECKMKLVERNCSCRPYFYLKSSNICSLADTVGCSSKVIAAINRNFSKYCDCPEPCTYEKFTTSVTYSPFPNYSFGWDLVKKYNLPSHDFIQKNFVGMTVYFDEIGSTVITQSPSYTLVAALNDLGGTSGLYIGFSFMTVIELAEVIAEFIQSKLMKKKNTVTNINTSVQSIQKEAFK